MQCSDYNRVKWWKWVFRVSKMLCSSIKLTDRREFKQDITPKRNKSTMLEEKLFMKSDYYHSYTFRWDKPKKHHYSCNNPQYLTVKDITFPENLSKNSDVSIVRMNKKTPRLKPKISPTGTFEQKECDEDVSIAVLTEQFSKETVELIEEIKSSVHIEENEDDIDPDIQQLISSTRESENEKLEENKINENKIAEKKRKKNKKKDKSEEEKLNNKEKSKTKTKIITFSISKPPTPQTVQVIRVDVTSNFSMEEEILDTNRTDSNLSDCSKGCGTKIRKNKEIKENLHKQASLAMDIGTNEVNLMCRRLTLKDRNDENINSRNA